MRCQEVRAARMISIMESLGVKSAKECSVADACKFYSRVSRGANKIAQPPLPPAILQQKGRQKRRARQTHPGKR